jgi:hypothetical protein
MASERWVSDMQSHFAQPSGSGTENGDAPAVEDLADNVVSLFAPREGSLAAMIMAAAGPAEPSELTGESELRATFRAAMLEKSRPARRRSRLAPFAIAGGSVVGLVAGTAGLSAAAVLPPAASHVVAQVLRPLGIDVAPSTTTAAPVVRTSTVATAASNQPKTGQSNGASGSLMPSTLVPAVVAAPTPNHVVLTCDVTVMVNRVETRDEVQITATNEASALKAVPAADRSGCAVNQGDKPASVPTTAGTDPGSGTGTGTGTTPKNGLNKGRRWHRRAGGHSAHHSGQATTGSTTGTATGHGKAKGVGTGTAQGSVGDTGPSGTAPTATTTPSGAPATTTQPLDAP